MKRREYFAPSEIGYNLESFLPKRKLGPIVIFERPKEDRLAQVRRELAELINARAN